MILVLLPNRHPGIGIGRIVRRTMVVVGVGTQTETIIVPEIVSMMTEGMTIVNGGDIIVEKVLLPTEVHEK